MSSLSFSLLLVDLEKNESEMLVQSVLSCVKLYCVMATVCVNVFVK